jgi:DNA-binding CsgD family transcriptional regulator
VAIPPAGRSDTVTVLRRAAAEALRRGSVDSAAAYLRRALSEPPDDRDRAGLLLELGLAESVTDVPAAVDHLRESLELSTESRSRALVASLLARTLFFADRTADAVSAAHPALDWLDPSRDAELRLQLEALMLASACMEPGLRELTDELASRARTEAGDSFGAKAFAAGGLYVDARAGMAVTKAVERARSALEGGVLLAEDNGRPASMTAVMVLTLSDSDLALPVLDAGFAGARERGDTFAIAGNMIFSCQARLVRGDLAAAIADGEAGLAAGDASGIAVALPWGCGFLAAAQLERGELDAAERTLARASRSADPPDTANWHQFLDTRSELLVRRGEHRAALEASLELGRRFEAVGGRNPAFVAWRSRAALCLVELAAERDRARALAQEEVELAREWGAPRALGAALRAQALVVGGEDGVDLLREAVAVLDPSPAQLEHARALIELGAAIARDRDPREARGPLDSGLRLARRCGAVPLVERAYTELEVTGVRPRRIVEAGVDALTPSERRVAELAASGLTNREIAECLFVTVKTVEFHLAGAYRKLDIGARAQLASALDAGEPQPIG